MIRTPSPAALRALGAALAGTLEKALSRYVTPEIFNTDQGSQFTSAEFTGEICVLTGTFREFT
jgi:hypothetical protein